MAVDGQPVSPAAVPEQMVLAPAQRLDLIVDVTAAEGEEAAIAVIDRDGAYAAVALPVRGTARAAACASSTSSKGKAMGMLMPSGRSTPSSKGSSGTSGTGKSASA